MTYQEAIQYAIDITYEYADQLMENHMERQASEACSKLMDIKSFLNVIGK